MKKRRAVLLLCLCLTLLCCGGPAYADDAIDAGAVVQPPGGEDDSQAIIGGGRVTLVRVDDLSARSTISCSCDQSARIIEVEIQVQRMDTETGLYYDYAEDAAYRYAYNQSSFMSVDNINVEHAGTYRIKVNFKAYFDSSTYSGGPVYSNAVAL